MDGMAYRLVLRGRKQLHEVVREDAHAAIQLPLPPAAVLQVLVQDVDDVALVNGQLVFVLSRVCKQDLSPFHWNEAKETVHYWMQKAAECSKCNKYGINGWADAENRNFLIICLNDGGKPKRNTMNPREQMQLDCNKTNRM